MVKVKNAEALKYLPNIDEFEDDFDACVALTEILGKRFGLREYYSEGVYYGEYDVENALKAQAENDRRFEEEIAKFTPPMITSIEDFENALQEAEHLCVLENSEAK